MADIMEWPTAELFSQLPASHIISLVSRNQIPYGSHNQLYNIKL